jgi:outer membrane protein
MRRKFKIAAQLSLIYFVATISLYGQTFATNATPQDSLVLDSIIQTVIQNHPSIKVAAEALNKADAQIGLAKSGYYPNVDITSNYSHVAPVPPAFDLPTVGPVTLFPKDNYSGALNVRQNIYDFGKTAKNVAFADEGKVIAEQSLGQVKQNMAMAVVRTYYTLDFLQEAIKIKEEQLKTLQEHLDYVQKMKATGSATSYEILSTKVKISGVESQELDLKASRDVQLSILNSLLGMPAKTYHAVKTVLSVMQPDVAQDSLISHALQHRDEMQLAKGKANLALLRLGVVKTQNNPSLNFIASGGFKNGYFPDVTQIKANYVVGLGLTIPIFDGTRTKYKLMEAKASVETSSLESEVTKRNISSEVVENETGVQTALKKVNQSKLQLEQAKEALSLAQINYKAGAVTNLDLLDATTTVSETRLMLLKSEIDYAVSIYKLKASLGERLY